MVDFSLSEEQELIAETAGSFASVLRERLREIEMQGNLPADVLATYAGMGLAGLDLPESVGGAALGLTTSCLAAEALAAGDLGAAYALPGFESAARMVRHLGDDIHHQRFLAPYLANPDWLGAVAWHDGETPLTATSSEEGLQLRGTCIAVDRAPIAGYFVARVDVEGRGPTLVAFGASLPGVRVDESRWKLGLTSTPAADVHFDDVVLDESAVLGTVDACHDGLRRVWMENAVVAAAFHLGVAKAAHEYALQYTQERVAFGKPIAHFQAVAFMLADAAMLVDAARWTVWRAAWALDRGDVAEEAVGQALVNASEAATRIVDDGVQLLGGAGYVFDHPVEKWMRDQKTLNLSGVTPEAAEDLLAACATGKAWSVSEQLPEGDHQTGLM